MRRIIKHTILFMFGFILLLSSSGCKDTTPIQWKYVNDRDICRERAQGIIGAYFSDYPCDAEEKNKSGALCQIFCDCMKQDGWDVSGCPKPVETAEKSSTPTPSPVPTQVYYNARNVINNPTIETQPQSGICCASNAANQTQNQSGNTAAPAQNTSTNSPPETKYQPSNPPASYANTSNNSGNNAANQMQYPPENPPIAAPPAPPQSQPVYNTTNTVNNPAPVSAPQASYQPQPVNNAYASNAPNNPAVAPVLRPPAESKPVNNAYVPRTGSSPAPEPVYQPQPVQQQPVNNASNTQPSPATSAQEQPQQPESNAQYPSTANITPENMTHNTLPPQYATDRDRCNQKSDSMIGIYFTPYTAHASEKDKNRAAFQLFCDCMKKDGWRIKACEPVICKPCTQTPAANTVPPAR